jgi:amidase
MNPQTDALADATAIDLIDRMSRKAISSVELTQCFIERIERLDKRLNAVVVRDFERAFAAARAADAALAEGAPLGPLHGLPMTVKESYDVAGLATTWGDRAAPTDVAKADAVVVSRLKSAGAVILGKTNVPLQLGDFQTYNEIYGQTNNPWDVARSPGGSSGGSAAALAAGLVALEFGSDLGGSVRNPAHYCGVYAHKPTWGIVPMRGHTPPGVARVPQDIDMAVVGPLARSADDLALALRVTAGPDVLTAPGWRLDLPAPRRSALRDLRIALWPDDDIAPVDREISDRVADLGARLAKLGATVSDSARPPFRAADAHETYRALVFALTGGPGGEISHQRWMETNVRRGEFRSAWRAFFEDWDVLVTPVAATTAFAHDHGEPMSRVLRVNGETRSYWQQVFWAGLASMPYLPATVFPTGLSQAGLPIGLQALGAELDDRTTIEFARLVGREFGGFERCPLP